MKPKKGLLTNALLDEIYKHLQEHQTEGPHKDGKPVYSFWIHGTKEEIEAARKKLLEIEEQWQ